VRRLCWEPRVSLVLADGIFWSSPVAAGQLPSKGKDGGSCSVGAGTESTSRDGGAGQQRCHQEGGVLGGNWEGWRVPWGTRGCQLGHQWGLVAAGKADRSVAGSLGFALSAQAARPARGKLFTMRRMGIDSAPVDARLGGFW
jgi:hypothetical protein